MSDVDPSDYDVAELRDLAGADGESGVDADADGDAGTGTDPGPAVGSGGPDPGASGEESPERPDRRRQSGTDDGAENEEAPFLRSTGSTSGDADGTDRDPASGETSTPRRLGVESSTSPASESESPTASGPGEAAGGEASLPEETDWTELGDDRTSEEADDGESAPSLVAPARRIDADGDDAAEGLPPTTGEGVGPGEDTISEIAEWTDIDVDPDGPDPTATGASAEPAGTAAGGSGLQFRGTPGLGVSEDDRPDSDPDPGTDDDTGHDGSTGADRGAGDRSGDRGRDHGRSVEDAGEAGDASDAGEAAAFEGLDVPSDSSTTEDPTDDEVPVFGDSGGDRSTTTSDPADRETPAGADGDSGTGSDDDGDPAASGEAEDDRSVLGSDDEPSLSERIEDILDGEDD